MKIKSCKHCEDVSIICTLPKNRFEYVDDSLYDRFTTPNCVPWNMKKNQVFTIISFHGPYKHQDAKFVGQHSVLYMTYIDLDNSSTQNGLYPISEEEEKRGYHIDSLY